MDSRFVYTSNKRLWEFHDCGHDGCSSMAVGQCESWVGGAFTGNLCAKPLCATHTFHIAGLPVCRGHVKKLAPVVEPTNAVQQGLF